MKLPVTLSKKSSIAFRCFFSVLSRELQSIFCSSFFYIATALFVSSVAFSFFVLGRFFAKGVASLDRFFFAMQFLSVGIIPLVTMRSWAGETNEASKAILLTLPVSSFPLVAAKYVSTVIPLFAMATMTAVIPFCATLFGSFDVGIIAGGYMGTAATVLAGAAAGMFFSFLCSSQIVAATSTFVYLIFSLMIHLIPQFYAVSDFAATVCRFFSFSMHASRFFRGYIDFRDCAFFGLTVLFFLESSCRLIYFRRWR